MPAPPSPRHAGLDTLRAIAVLAVVLFHLTIFGQLPPALLPVTRFGWMGVDLFFVLSGYLIGQQVLRPLAAGQRLPLLDFYRRRAIRILPTYLVVLALYLLLPACRESPNLPAAWKFLTFAMNLHSNPSQHAFSHAWSLCVEEHFYLILPLAALALARRPSPRKTVTTLAAVLLAGIALRAFLITRYPDSVYPLIYYPTWTRLDGLLFGVSLAVLRLFRPALWRRILGHGHLLLLVGLLAISAVLALFWQNDIGSPDAVLGTVLGLPLLSFGLAAITASALSHNGLPARIRVPGAHTLAALAFTLYLTHKAVAHTVQHAFPRLTDPRGPASWLLYAFTCLAVALFLHHAVELPCLRLRDRLSPSRSTLESIALQDPAL